MALRMNGATLPTAAPPPVIPPPPDLQEALLRATCKQDVRLLQQNHGADALQAAWRQLPSIDRAALLLARYSDGTILHDLNPADFGAVNPVPDQPAAAR
jgi:hypothetical protein